MPSPKSSRKNLENWRRLAGLRSDQESLMIKHAIWQWGLTPAEQQQPATLSELAIQLGISRQYAEKVMSRVNFDAPLDLLERSAITPAQVIAFRQRQQQYRQAPTIAQYAPPEHVPLSQRPTATEWDSRRPHIEKVEAARQESPTRYSNGMSIYTQPKTLKEWDQIRRRGRYRHPRMLY